VSRPAVKPVTPPTGGQLCTMLAVDIAGFTKPHRDDEIRLYLHEDCTNCSSGRLTALTSRGPIASCPASRRSLSCLPLRFRQPRVTVIRSSIPS
jgi:hypothetical protein